MDCAERPVAVGHADRIVDGDQSDGQAGRGAPSRGAEARRHPGQRRLDVKRRRECARDVPRALELLMGELGVAVHEAGDVEDPIPLGVDGVGERQGAGCVVRDGGAHFFCS